jgi:hypothetical protein
VGCVPRTLLLRRGRSRLLLFPMDKDPDRKARVEVELLQFDNADAFRADRGLFCSRIFRYSVDNENL